MNHPPAADPHRISLEAAVKMTATYRNQKEAVIAKALKNKTTLPVSETFERAAFDRLLAQPGCTAVRFYFSMDDVLQLRAVIVGVNEKGEDMLPATEETAGEIVENGKLCPPLCAPASQLNP